MNLDVCIETVFTGLPYWKRVEKVAQIGFRGVEFWHPEGTWDGEGINTNFPKDADVLLKACKDTGVSVRGFVVNAWDGLFGGCPSRAADHAKFLDQVKRMIDFAEAVECHSGVIMTGLTQDDLTPEYEEANIRVALEKALALAEPRDFTLLVEPLNTIVDHAGFALSSVDAAASLVRGFKSRNMKLLFDIYHMQIMSGNVVDSLRGVSDILGHIHIAGVPRRAEPDVCELDYRYILSQVAEMGYTGWAGLEYFPSDEPEASLTRQLSLVQGD